MTPPSDPLASLLTAFVSCDSAFRLMELLMQFCRDQAADFRAWDNNPALKAAARPASAEARRIVTDEIGTVFTFEDDPATLARIRATVAGYLGQADPPAVARAQLLLNAFDSHLTPNLRALYQDFHPGPLAPGGLFPVYWPDLKSIGWFPPGTFSPPPFALSQPPGFLSKWALAPPQDVFSARRVEFVFADRADVSPPLAGPLALGVGVLNATRDELTWDKDDAAAQFRDVRPRDPAAQVAAMCRVATRAAAEGVRVLVFPELCIDRTGADEVFRHVAGLSAPPALVVIGSHHWSDGTVRRNTCTAYRSGTARPLNHHKIAPFSFREGGITFREDITPGDMVRVYVATDWSLVLLVCRDFLDTALRQLVESLRPTFLCVPSFSQTPPFVEFVGAVTASAQTVVVFANGPVPADRVTAVFGVPRVPQKPGSGAALARQDVMPEPLPPLPCLVIYDGIADTLRRLPC